MARDTATRKWQLTINNPVEKKYSHDALKDIINNCSSVIYWCMCDEIGENGTYHTHIYIYFKNAVMFSTMKNKFNGAHFEMARGTSLQNREYITKSGKWENDEKHETNLSYTFEESGECPIERQGQRNDLEDLYSYIKQGLSNYEILELDASNIMRLDKIDKTRTTYLTSLYKDKRRLDIDVTYICGKTGTGKTRSVLDEFGDGKVFRVIDYHHPFDMYECQDIIVFEEFRNSLKIQDMLNYLDIYPLQLPCRYSNKVACFTKVFIISNWSLEEQYKDIQVHHKETWNAFLRRINKVKVYDSNEIIEYTTNDYLNRFRKMTKVEENETKEVFNWE